MSDITTRIQECMYCTSVAGLEPNVLYLGRTELVDLVALIQSLGYITNINLNEDNADLMFYRGMVIVPVMRSSWLAVGVAAR